MPFTISGYVLEPPRVGQSNSPFTITPNDFISDYSAFNTAYPSSEANPRDDYLVFVSSELAAGAANASVAVTNVINSANTVQIHTAAVHNLTTGQWVVIKDVLGVPGANGTFTVVAINAHDFLLVGSTFTGAYGGGGTVLEFVGSPGLLINAGFGWTKNEIIPRFDYDGRAGTFKPLPGGPIAQAGMLTTMANTTGHRLKVPAPIGVFPSAPFRLFLGSSGSGLTFALTLVSTDVDFGSPATMTAELSKATGNLNWNTTDLATYSGEIVQFQQQNFFQYTKSSGNIGTLGVTPVIMLNPIPGTGQLPLVRIGYRSWLQGIEVPNEAAFTTPVAGTYQWALTTGRLNFNPGDVTFYDGKGIYYDGVVFALDLVLPRVDIGTVASPTPLATPVPIGGEIILALPANKPYYQFPQTQVALLPQGGARLLFPQPAGPTAGVAVIDSLTGANVLPYYNSIFSQADIIEFGSQPLRAIYGDLPIEHGVSIRFFRTPVNVTGQSTVHDVTNTYIVGPPSAEWASPIIGSPVVFLPSVPTDDGSLVVSINQGQGTFPPGNISRLDVPNPPLGIGYAINFDTRQFQFANSRSNVIIPLLTGSGAFQIPDPLLLQGNLVLSLETGPVTGVYLPLSLTTDVIVDYGSGAAFFISIQGLSLANGSTGSFALTTFTDTTAQFVADGVVAGDFLEVLSGTPADGQGVYTITAATPTTLTTDVGPSLGGVPVEYNVYSGKEILADRYFEPVSLIDPTFSLERIRALGTIADALNLVASGSATFTDLNTLSDTGTDFVAAGVQPGDTITITSGPSNNKSYLIRIVTQHTLAPDVPFTGVLGATYTVNRRLNIPTNTIATTRFRYGYDPFYSTVLNTVANDATGFSTPSSLPQGTVEVSLETGNLNFAQADVTPGGPVFWMRKLAIEKDFIIVPQLGTIQFNTRLLTNEEALITYTTQPPDTTPPSPPGPPVTEQATFIVRKEVSQPHATPTSVVTFNPSGHTVAPTPPPRVFRGGRPWTNLTVDTKHSTVTFLPDNILTDALPHGAIINPNENIYIDYYIYQAMGGEQNFTVLQPPMLTASIVITQGTNFFKVMGDQTPIFQEGLLLRVNTNEIYMLAAPVYDAGLNETTVTLSATQDFIDTQVNPSLDISSGPIRLTAVAQQPAYFSPEFQPFEPIARGMNKMTLPGDRTSSYKTGTIIYFTDGGGSFTDFAAVTGAKFDPLAGKTEVGLNVNVVRQYMYGSQILWYSVRPVFEFGSKTASTLKTPVLTQPFSLFRRVEGQQGVLLQSPQDYTIDDTGVVTYTTPLAPLEEISIFYTGHKGGTPGASVKAAYVCVIAPTQGNGLLGQILNADYHLFQPDSFYFRVETLTNFKGEVAKDLKASAQSGAPSGGPMTSNTASATLQTQGRESLFFQEGHLYNQDIVARASLRFYDDLINSLEDVLEDMDGRVIGNLSGRLIFDGGTGQNRPPGIVTNQIDDVIEVSPAPFKVDFSPFTFTVTSIGTYQALYLPSAYSRFYPTRKQFFGVCAGGKSTGDEVLDTGEKNILGIGEVHTRFAFATTTVQANAGSTTLFVDFAQGDAFLARPPFIAGMDVLIQARSGSFLNSPDGSALGAVQNPVTILGVPNAHTLNVSPLPGNIPAGSTIWRSIEDHSQFQDQQNPPDPPPINSITYYQGGRDYGLNSDSGQVYYVQPFFPLNGVHLLFLKLPIQLECHPLQAGAYITGQISFVNSLKSPKKIPALYGQTVDDDGDLHFPIQTPSPNSEAHPTNPNSGNLSHESLIIAPSGPQAIQTVTTAPFVGAGNLNAAKTIITLASGTFPSPVPQQYDLVRILSGTNGATAFRRITSATANSVTVAVADAFSLVDTNFQFTVAVSSTTTAGTATLSGFNLHDAAVPSPFTTGPVVVKGNTHGVVVLTGNTHVPLAITGDTHGTATIDNIQPGTAGIAIGDPISGPADVVSGTKVLTIVDAHSITVDTATTGVGSAGEGLSVGGVTIDNLSPGSGGLSVGDPITGTGISTVTVTGNTHGTITIDGITPNTTGIYIGDAIKGADIPANTTVASIVGASSITISNPATGPGTTGESLTFVPTIASIPGGTSIKITAPATTSETGTTLTVGPPVGTPIAGLTIDNITPAIALAFSPGDAISGAGIPAGATVATIVNSSKITISTSATSSATQTYLTVMLATTVAPGWTVVMTSGPNAGNRRQIAAVADNSNLTLDFQFPSATGGTYRIDNPLDTYGNAPGDLYSQLVTALAGELVLYLPSPTPPTGVAASVNTQGNGLQAVTGLTGMIPTYVGQTLGLTNTAFIEVLGVLAPNSGYPNTGRFQIVDVVSPTSVIIGNGNGISDPNNGSINWFVEAPASEITGLLNFLNLGMTDFLTSPSGATTGTTLTDTTVNFQTSGVRTTMYLFIQSGPSAGFYGIAAVASATTITVDVPFPLPDVGVSYRIVTLFGISKQSVLDAFSVYQSVAAFVAGTLAFQSLVTTPVSVLLSGVADPLEWARGYLVSDFILRAGLTGVAGQIASLTPSIAKIEKILKTSDNLYDKRYVWIDGRINLETGVLSQQARALQTRYDNQTKVYNQLTKLLAVEGS